MWNMESSAIESLLEVMQGTLRKFGIFWIMHTGGEKIRPSCAIDTSWKDGEGAVAVYCEEEYDHYTLKFSTVTQDYRLRVIQAIFDYPTLEKQAEW